MKVLVTGATGYLGASLARALLADGHGVIAFGRDRAKLERLRAWCGASAAHLDCVCAELESLEHLPSGADGLIHSAALRAPACAQDPAAAARINVQCTSRLLRLAGAHGVRCVVYISSQSVYGRQPAPWSETLTPLPEGPYALTKLCGEGLVAELGSAYRWAILRLSRLYGVTPFRHRSELLDKFVHLVRLGKRLPVHGDGEQRLDLLHVEDAVACVIRLLQAPEARWNTVYNVGAGKSVSVNELVDALVRSAQQLGLPAVRVERRLADGAGPHLELDTTRVRAALGWLPERGLSGVVKEYLLADDEGAKK